MIGCYMPVSHVMATFDQSDHSKAIHLTSSKQERSFSLPSHLVSRGPVDERTTVARSPAVADDSDVNDVGFMNNDLNDVFAVVRCGVGFNDDVRSVVDSESFSDCGLSMLMASSWVSVSSSLRPLVVEFLIWSQQKLFPLLLRPSSMRLG